MIRIEGLTKYFGKRLVLDDVSFHIGQNEIVGFLGPNGAGKTTTMRIVTGYLKPTRGGVWVAGKDAVRDSLEARRRIGYLPEQVPLYFDMTTRRYLEFAGRLKGLDRKTALRRVDEVMDRCHLGDYADVILSKLSKGFRQRVGLAQAIIHEPEVLILDEPTTGIDPIEVAQTRDLIRELGKNHTVFLSSHILPEVGMICDRVIVIHRGKIAADDRIENLSSLFQERMRIRLDIEGPENEVIAALRGTEGVRDVVRDRSDYLVECVSGEDPRAGITGTIVRNSWALRGMEVMRMSLEKIFLDLTTGEGESEDTHHSREGD